MKKINTDDYFKPKNYFSYILTKIRQGDLWKTVTTAYKKIRKFTIISAIFRAIGITLTLLEKSAVLLLAVTCIVLVLPLIIGVMIVYAILCVAKYASLHKKISKWLVSGEKLTVFITKERIFSISDTPMFLADASSEASRFSHPVIVLCRDRFIAAKWYSLNLLAVKADYFFVIKRYYLPKRSGKITFIVL